jgi:hypothetical protein
VAIDGRALTIERDGQRQDAAVTIPRSADRTPAYFAIVAWLPIPIFSLLLGFWAAIIQAIMERADAFAAEGSQHDDMTLMIAQVTPQDAECFACKL